MNKKHSDRDYRRLWVFLTVTVMVITLAGCGQEDTLAADAQVQEVVLDTTEIAAEDTPAGDDTAVQPSESAAARTGVEPQQNPIAKEQLEMDEETRQQLMSELLEENELDVSVVESQRVTKGCTFDLPEGFAESTDTDNLYITERYPLDTSMIYYEVMEGDISLQLMTENMFKEEAEESLGQAYGEDTVIDIDSYESLKIDGYPAFRILCHYEVDHIKITQLEYIINADKTYVITYSQTNDCDWMEAYETSAATIHVK